MADPKQPDCTITTPVDHPEHEEEKLDEAIDETFPASDPISVRIDEPWRPEETRGESTRNRR